MSSNQAGSDGVTHLKGICQGRKGFLQKERASSLTYLQIEN